jgi:glycolate oxidase FAD binding subunit
VICEATLRLHPVPERTVTVAGRAADPGVLARAGRLLAARALELEALDLRWDGAAAGGCVLARAGGRSAQRTAEAVAALLQGAGIEAAIDDDDDDVWAQQRARQRPPDGGAVVRVSTLPAQLETLLRASESAVVRAGLGLAWVRLAGDDPEALGRLRAAVAPAPCVLESAPAQLRAAVDPWGLGAGPELELLRRVKARFDPAGVCNPGRYVGGI